MLGILSFASRERKRHGEALHIRLQSVHLEGRHRAVEGSTTRTRLLGKNSEIWPGTTVRFIKTRYVFHRFTVS